MSKFVDEIIDDIKSNPDSWRDQIGYGIKKDRIIITGHGNSAILSVIDVYVNNKQITRTYIDAFRLEKAVSWWYKNVSLKTISAL